MGTIFRNNNNRLTLPTTIDNEEIAQQLPTKLQDQIPSTSCNDDCCDTEESYTCAICLEDCFDNGEEGNNNTIVWSETSDCKHMFCEECIVDYFSNMKRDKDQDNEIINPCPIC